MALRLSFVLTLLAARGVMAAPMSQVPRPGALAGQVSSPAGAPISSVAIAVIAPNGQIKFALSGERGRFVVSPLPPGRYTVWAWSKGFTLYQGFNLRIAPGHQSSLDILLRQEPPGNQPEGTALIAAGDPGLPAGRSQQWPGVADSPSSLTPCLALAASGTAECP
jgi:hypothetical protein